MANEKYAIHVTMPDNSVWEIEARPIAVRMSEAFFHHPDWTPEYLMADSDCVAMWAVLNMTWEELLPLAHCIKQPDPPYSRWWKKDSLRDVVKAGSANRLGQ